MTQRSAHTTRTRGGFAVIAQRFILGLFEVWRRALGSALTTTSRSVDGLGRAFRRWGTHRDRWAARWLRVIGYYLDPHAADHATTTAAAAVGARAFIAGLVIAGAVTAASKGTWGPAAVTVASELVWAGARFVIVAALLHHRTITRPLLAAVFLAGLAPYLFGATAWLRVACLASSAALTRRGLVAADVSPRDATIAVAWAFGGQAGALALAWIAKAAIALLVGT